MLHVSGKLPTYPSPNPTLTLSFHLGQNVDFGEGWVGGYPETYNDPYNLSIGFWIPSCGFRNAGSGF